MKNISISWTFMLLERNVVVFGVFKDLSSSKPGSCFRESRE